LASWKRSPLHVVAAAAVLGALASAAGLA